MSILIFANGELDPAGWAQVHLDTATAIIAADGGVHHVLALGRMPDVVIGDFDSIASSTRSELQMAAVEFVVYPRDKDASDLELALRYAATNYHEEILILGSLGGRLDQMLANVLLLTDPFLQGKEVRIVEAHQQAWVVGEGEGHIRGRRGDFVSLLPLRGDAFVKRTVGLQWELTNERLEFGRSRGVSNVMTADSALFEVKSGKVLCIHTDKKWRR
ncbi:MAG TPA: thiamine diphosphokinase [Anaerolineae bacterium]|jgi:thiamine pyrophosphokinase|nr:thiamine diphosphokinase [Anaerolineae bacterium]